MDTEIDDLKNEIDDLKNEIVLLKLRVAKLSRCINTYLTVWTCPECGELALQGHICPNCHYDSSSGEIRK